MTSKNGACELLYMLKIITQPSTLNTLLWLSIMATILPALVWQLLQYEILIYHLEKMGGMAQ